LKGCIITQSNPSLRTGIALLNSTTVSSLPTLATTAILTSPRLPNLLALNRARLASSFAILRSYLLRWDVEFITPTAGLYVFAKLGKDVGTEQEENEMVEKLKREGVLVLGGKQFKAGVEGRGWVRIGFCVGEGMLKEGLERVERCLFGGRRGIGVWRSRRKRRRI
jgi:gliotoxin/aspirochlorine biosynthesis aminotransferase